MYSFSVFFFYFFFVIWSGLTASLPSGCSSRVVRRTPAAGRPLGGETPDSWLLLFTFSPFFHSVTPVSCPRLLTFVFLLLCVVPRKVRRVATCCCVAIFVFYYRIYQYF